MSSIQNELKIFYRNLREITFRLTNVIPERIIFVSRGITVLEWEKRSRTRFELNAVCVCLETFKSEIIPLNSKIFLNIL